MSVDKALQAMIRDEVHALIAPLAHAVEQLQSGGNVAAQLQALLGGGAARRGPGRPPKLSFGFKRGPGRPPKALSAGPARKGKVGRPRSGGGSACAIIGCRRPSRSKGYCAAHYQKQRMLTKTHRLPADWVDGATPQSVKDIVLPRGRAGARALADARKK